MTGVALMVEGAGKKKEKKKFFFLFVENDKKVKKKNHFLASPIPSFVDSFDLQSATISEKLPSSTPHPRDALQTRIR